MIAVDNLCKNYSYYKKEEGISGSIQNIFHRKTLIKEAVKNVSFNIERGEMIGLIGLNGAGKTTLLKMLTGIIKPTSGEVKVMGHTPYNKDNSFLNEISMVMGNKSQLWWDLPAIDSFELNSKIYGIEKNKYQNVLNELVEVLEVKDLVNIQVRRLSLGERMRMEIINSLLHNPSILFLDEPTIGLDILSQAKIRDFLKEYCKNNNTTVILTSHNFEDFVSLAQRLLLINAGEIVLDMSYSNFLKKYSTSKIITIKTEQVKIVKNKLFSAEGINLELIEVTEDTVKFSVVEEHVSYLMSLIFGDNTYTVQDINVEGIDLKQLIANIYDAKRR